MLDFEDEVVNKHTGQEIWGSSLKAGFEMGFDGHYTWFLFQHWRYPNIFL